MKTSITFTLNGQQVEASNEETIWDCPRETDNFYKKGDNFYFFLGGKR